MAFTDSDILKIKNEVAKRKESYPQEWLGRSLAYTPYQPRGLNLEQKRILNIKDSTICANLLESLKQSEAEFDIIFTRSLELLTYLRRYINKPFVYDFLILDSYQLLEALVYGADGICLYPQFLEQKELNELSNYALKIGLERVFYATSNKDLTKAIFAKADILHICKNKELISLIPKGKIILSDDS